jgi:hypothetical protein
MAEEVNDYIEEIASLRRELFQLQNHYRSLLRREGNTVTAHKEKIHEVADLKGEISRHHKDFMRISKLAGEALDATEEVDYDQTSANLRQALKTIQNIVG